MFSERIENAIADANDKYGKRYVITSDTAPYIMVQSERHTAKQKLGKFLSVLNNANLVKELVEEYKQLNSDISTYTVSFSTDYEEVYGYPLYAFGSIHRSCMFGMECVKVYEEDERLKMLLIHKEDVLVGRTLVRDDVKQYVRIYIDHNYIKDFVAVAILSKYGYKQGDLEGIRLSKIECSYGYLMPYLDGEADIVDDRGDYFQVSYYGEHIADSTSGYLKVTKCTCCGEHTHEDELTYVEYDDGQVCESCFNANYVWYDFVVYAINDCVTNESNGALVPESIAQTTLVCISNGDWYDMDDVVHTVDDECELADDCHELVLELNDERYVLKEYAIYISDREGFEDGYYVQEQIDEIEEELMNEKQTNLFDLINELN